MGKDPWQMGKVRHEQPQGQGAPYNKSRSSGGWGVQPEQSGAVILISQELQNRRSSGATPMVTFSRTVLF